MDMSNNYMASNQGNYVNDEMNGNYGYNGMNGNYPINEMNGNYGYNGMNGNYPINEMNENCGNNMNEIYWSYNINNCYGIN